MVSGSQPRFHTGLFSLDPFGEAFDIRASSWSYEKSSGQFSGPPSALSKASERLREMRDRAPSATHHRDAVFFDMEVLVRARTDRIALKAYHLLLSSLSVIDGSIASVPEPFDRKMSETTGDSLSRYGLVKACQLASKLSRRRASAYAGHKLALSYRNSSPHLVDLIPNYEPRRFGVEDDPLSHVYLANAITLAHSAIEELELEVRGKPPKESGVWNEKSKNDLERRLRSAGVNVDEGQIWTIRGGSTRVAKEHTPPIQQKTDWTAGIVRDREVALIEALWSAKTIRNSITTHRFNKKSRSLTVYDAHNVQSLARRLILEKFGFWRDD